MTFGGHIGYLWSEWSEGANDATRDTKLINYMPTKSHLIIIIINRPNGCLSPSFD